VIGAAVTTAARAAIVATGTVVRVGTVAPAATARAAKAAGIMVPSRNSHPRS
jgi:hypothetical protein